MAEPRILLIIPAQNEAANLAQVIDEARAALEAGIVVVDDGSTDGTGEIAVEKGVELLSLPFNLGIGGAMQTGYRFARNGGYDIAVQVDGDGQHDAGQVPQLIEPLLSGECDMTVGSRYLKKDSYNGPAARRLGTAVFSRILSLILRQRLTDATSGFRAVNRDLIGLFARDYPRDYPEVEALLLVHMAHRRICEIPVTMRLREGGRSSISAFRSIYYMVKVLLALIVVASRKREPL